MGVYLFAFIAFTLDLAKRSSESPAAVAVAAPLARVVGQLSSASTTTLLERTATPPPAPTRKSSRFERVAFSLTVLAWLLHVGGTVLRGVAAHRVPWANMFEFSLTASAIIVGVFIVVQLWQNLKFLGAYISGFALIVLGFGTVGFYVNVVPLPPALQSYWLIIHVFVATLGTAFFAIGAGLSIAQLIQSRRESSKIGGLGFLATFPDAVKLENLAYRVIVVGFVFWTFTLMAGAIWAEHAWGRYWGWDTKEVWTFIIWTIFAGYIHARATRGWRGSRSSWLAIVGFAAVMFNFTIVNLFFKGLHAYSGL
ncbi:c-type cytochrome biogenesis protein CcsB [Lacisediminihabitans sp. G11-30]|uniref:C-type cytochrome biogenesis protein CcsB n=2 Tax=Lacisediminihabitans changchengi TaxID=2787634 RepID=A0A934SLU8_9MICO|nr:c-type cytochrome biogenesis protein CcsB [Lacisediminihabitans changchengi]MBK4349011.1 c-type cytochrome biogenesis protein CcsB [Lacisediminihabitans changchengi]